MFLPSLFFFILFSTFKPPDYFSKSSGDYTPVLFRIVCANFSPISLCRGIVSFFTPLVYMSWLEPFLNRYHPPCSKRLTRSLRFKHVPSFHSICNFIIRIECVYVNTLCVFNAYNYLIYLFLRISVKTSE